MPWDNLSSGDSRAFIVGVLAGWLVLIILYAADWAVQQ